MIKNGDKLYRRFIIDSIVEKAKTYSAFKRLAGIVCVISYIWMIFTFINASIEGERDVLSPIVVTTILSVVNCLLPSTKYFAETMVINNKDIDDDDKYDTVMEVKAELISTY